MGSWRWTEQGGRCAEVDARIGLGEGEGDSHTGGEHQVYWAEVAPGFTAEAVRD